MQNCLKWQSVYSSPSHFGVWSPGTSVFKNHRFADDLAARGSTRFHPVPPFPPDPKLLDTHLALGSAPAPPCWSRWPPDPTKFCWVSWKWKGGPPWVFIISRQSFRLSPWTTSDTLQTFRFQLHKSKPHFFPQRRLVAAHRLYVEIFVEALIFAFWASACPCKMKPSRKAGLSDRYFKPPLAGEVRYVEMGGKSGRHAQTHTHRDITIVILYILVYMCNSLFCVCVQWKLFEFPRKSRWPYPYPRVFPLRTLITDLASNAALGYLGCPCASHCFA